MHTFTAGSVPPLPLCMSLLSVESSTSWWKSCSCNSSGSSNVLAPPLCMPTSVRLSCVPKRSVWRTLVHTSSSYWGASGHVTSSTVFRLSPPPAGAISSGWIRWARLLSTVLLLKTYTAQIWQTFWVPMFVISALPINVFIRCSYLHSSAPSTLGNTYMYPCQAKRLDCCRNYNTILLLCYEHLLHALHMC